MLTSSKPRITEGMFTSRSEEYETPDSVFKPLDQEFHFTLDVCASDQNHKCDRYFTWATDARLRDWTGVCWMNPPYGKQIYSLMKKAYGESKRGATVVVLVPSRTDTEWWHEFAMKADEIRFVQGRIKFKGSGKNGAPFPSCVLVFRPPIHSGTFHNEPKISSIKFD